MLRLEQEATDRTVQRPPHGPSVLSLGHQALQALCSGPALGSREGFTSGRPG